MNRDYPNEVQSEMFLLGSVFQHPPVMARLSGMLNPQDFYGEKHRAVWTAMQKLHSANEEIDIPHVSNWLKKNSSENFENLFGKDGYLFDLMESVSSPANADYFAELIYKSSILRRLINCCAKTSALAFDAGADADTLLSSILEQITAIASHSSHTEDEHISAIALEVLETIKGHIGTGTPMGASTGFYELDKITGGLRSGELVIVGARTGMGKTSFAMDIALHAAKTMPVKFFSLEMAKKQIAPRALSFFSQVSLKRTINADIDESELHSQYAVIEKLRDLCLYMEFEAGLSIGEICSSSHAFTARHGKGLILIDHLHYLKTGEKANENRNIELGKITHSLKELAKKLDIPILLLSQLNRDIDRNAAKDKMPRLSDLRDSGNIEQDADMVWFIHRPGYYDNNSDPSETRVKVAKNRSGPTGEVKLHFDTTTTKFSDTNLFAFGEQI